VSSALFVSMTVLLLVLGVVLGWLLRSLLDEWRAR